MTLRSIRNSLAENQRVFHYTKSLVITGRERRGQKRIEIAVRLQSRDAAKKHACHR